MKPKGYKSLNGLWWVYPVATWLGGAIAGIGKHVIKGAHDSLKESEEYRYSEVAALIPEGVKVNSSAKVSLDKSVEDLDVTEQDSVIRNVLNGSEN